MLPPLTGCHADIGGGWPLEQGEEIALSHPPLVWMIREAWRAGLPFDIEALREQNFLIDEEIPATPTHTQLLPTKRAKPASTTQKKPKHPVCTVSTPLTPPFPF